MKISGDTLSILGNFGSIHGSIKIEQGSVIKTRNSGKTIVGIANVDETFPKDFGIYDLNQFLCVVNALDEPEFEFQEEFVNLVSGNQKIQYVYTDPTLLHEVPSNLHFPEQAVTFDLSESNRKRINKISGILGLPHVTVEANPFRIVVWDGTGAKKNKYDIYLDDGDVEIKSVKNYHPMTLLIDNLKILSGDYTVKITNEGISTFSHKNIDLTYYVACESQNSITR